MDCSWLDPGDLVEVVTADAAVRGEVVRVTEEALLIRNAKGLKSQIAVASILRIEQVESLDAPAAPAPAPAAPAAKEPQEGTIAAACRELLACAEALEVPTAVAYTDYAALKKRNAIYNSIHHAATKDKSSLDEKVATAIRKLRIEYDETRDSELPALIAYLHTLRTKAPEKDSHFAAAMTFLQQYGDAHTLRDFFLAHGTPAEQLPFWTAFRGEMAVLLRAFVLPYRNTLETNDLMAPFVHGVYADTTLSVGDKNILLYALATRLFDPATLPAQEAQDNPALAEHLYRRLTAVVGEAAPVAAPAAPAPVAPPAKKPTVEKTEFVVTTAADPNYSTRFTARLHKAKTPEKFQQLEKDLLAYVEEGGGNTLSALNDLMMMCLRKDYGKYSTVLRCYEKYKDHPLYAPPEEQVKLRHFAATAYEMKAVDVEDYDPAEARRAREMALSLWKEQVASLLREDASKYSDTFVRVIQLLNSFDRYEEALSYCRMAQEYVIRLERTLSKELGYPQKSQIFYVLPVIVRGKLAAAARRNGDEETARRYVAEAEEILDKFGAKYGAVVTLRVQKLREVLYSTDENDFENLISSSPLEELTTTLLTGRIRRCRFPRLADLLAQEVPLKGDEKSGFRWDGSVSQAVDGYRRLKNAVGSAFSEGHVQPDPKVRRKIADFHLEMAKISEYLTEQYSDDANYEEGKKDKADYDTWKGHFIEHAATYMWLQYYTDSPADTRVYYLMEALRLFSGVDAATVKVEYMDALNSLLLMHVQGDASAYRLSVKFTKMTKESERYEVRRQIAATLQRAARDNLPAVTATLNRLALLCKRSGDRLLVELSGLVMTQDKEGRAPLVKWVYDRIEDADAPLNDDGRETTLREALRRCADITKDRRTRIDALLQQLEYPLKQGRVDDCYRNMELLDQQLADPTDGGYTVTDRRRWELLKKHLEAFIDLLTDKGISSADKRRQLMEIESMAEEAADAFYTNPTELAARLQSVYVVLAAQAVALRNELEEQMGPCVTVEEFHGEDGYYFDSDTGRIRLMLRLTNTAGRLAARHVQVQVDAGDNALWQSDHEWHVVCERLEGGRCAYCHDVYLQLTDAQALGGTLTLPLTVSYRSEYRETPVETAWELTVHIQQEDAFRRISNPYAPEPITPQNKARVKTFKGREEELKLLGGSLADSVGGKTVILYGQFRSGKTSLGNFVADAACRLNPDVVYVWAGDVLDADRAKDVVSKIRNKIIARLTAACGVDKATAFATYGSVEVTDENYPTVFTGFAEELRLCLQAIGKSVLVQLDEFGRFCTGMEETATFMAVWKNVMTLEAFNAILIGHDVITQLMRLDPNTFAVAEKKQVSYLTREAVSKVVHDPTRTAEGVSHFCEDVVDFVWEQTAGNVFYTQNLCSIAVNYMNTHHIHRLNAAYMREALEEWKDTVDVAEMDYLGHAMYRSGEVGEGAVTDREAQMLLDAIIVTVDREATLDYAVEHYGVTAERAAHILHSLRDRSVVDYNDGRYQVRCHFYEDYINPFIVRTLGES